MKNLPEKLQNNPGGVDESQQHTIKGISDQQDQLPVSRMQTNALIFFDGTQMLHLLPVESRAILKAVAWLERAELPDIKKELSPATISLLSSHLDMQLSQDGERTLLALVGLRAGNFRQKDLAYLGFSLEQQRAARTLATIMEIVLRLERIAKKIQIQSIQLTKTDVIAILEEPLSKKKAAAMYRKSSLWQELGYPEVQFLDPTEARLWLLPFPALAENSGITVDDTIGEAGRKTMRFLFAHMLAHEEETRRGEDIEALHDMRVATRRLRAAFEVYSVAFEKSALKPHLSGLRQTGRALGAVRDLDVFMEKAQKYIANLPEERRHGLDPLLEHWAGQREEARARMLLHLNSREYAWFKRDFNIFLNSPGAGEPIPAQGQIAPQLIRQLVPILVYERMASVRAFASLLEDAPIERLHMLRIEFKKLRYSLEYFVDVLGKQAAQAIEDIKALQDHLGDLNDAVVATQILSDFLNNWGAENQSVTDIERQKLDEVVNYLKYRMDERDRLQKTFISAWNLHFQNRAFRRNIARAVSVL